VAHAWIFPGGSPSSSTVEDPGFVIFGTPGTYTVQYNVVDDRGASDPSPATRTITVIAPVGSSVPPEAAIVSPATNVTVPAGSVVRFDGQATDPDGSIVSVRWDFGGGAPPSSAEDPAVTFSRAGVFTITFNATDNDGLSDPTPGRRVITVTEMPAANRPPEARIDVPAAARTIGVGESITFAGTAHDADGTVVAHSWSFGGAPARSVEDPGPVTFTVPGTYLVEYNVTDDDGASDPSPARVTVVVLPEGGGSDAGLNVDATAPGSATRVDGHDVVFVIRAIATQDLRADVNGDRRVDETDVQLTLAALGQVQ
jgi:hypothetical protein